MEFDPLSKIWENLTTLQEGISPLPRANHGFASALDKIYVYGGVDKNGDFFVPVLKYVVSKKSNHKLGWLLTNYASSLHFTGI